MNLPKTEAILKVVGDTAVQLIQADIIAKDKVATRNLFNSINAKVEKNNFSLNVNVYGAEYFDDIIKGREENDTTRKLPAIANLIRWVKIKSIATEPIAAQRAAWAIREHIFKNGIPPVNLLEFVKAKLEADITDEVKKAIRQDINANFIGILQKYK